MIKNRVFFCSNTSPLLINWLVKRNSPVDGSHRRWLSAKRSAKANTGNANAKNNRAEIQFSLSSIKINKTKKKTRKYLLHFCVFAEQRRRIRWRRRERKLTESKKCLLKSIDWFDLVDLEGPMNGQWRSTQTQIWTLARKTNNNKAFSFSQRNQRVSPKSYRNEKMRNSQFSIQVVRIWAGLQQSHKFMLVYEFLLKIINERNERWMNILKWLCSTRLHSAHILNWIRVYRLLRECATFFSRAIILTQQLFYWFGFDASSTGCAPGQQSIESLSQNIGLASNRIRFGKAVAHIDDRDSPMNMKWEAMRLLNNVRCEFMTEQLDAMPTRELSSTAWWRDNIENQTIIRAETRSEIQLRHFPKTAVGCESTAAKIFSPPPVRLMDAQLQHS